LINVFADGVISNREDDGTNAPGADNYPRVPRGERMGGTYYPLLLDAEEAYSGFTESIPTINDV
jgi:hypothetical protein